MSPHRAFLACALCLAALTVSPPVRAEEAPSAPAPAPPAQPDATIHISAKSLSAGLGYSWGKGTLEYQGKTYPVSMDGLLVLAVGFSSVDATGHVYNLKSLDDFDGKYAGVRGGGAIGEGGAGVAMQNEKGVEVRMVTEQTGVTLTLGASGVKLALEK